MKIGIYGGTFDPPHLGHMEAARAAMRYLGLTRLYLIPTKQPPHKFLPEDAASAADRYAMTEMMADGLGRGVTCLDVEIKREGPSFTVDTLRALKEQMPEAQLYLLLGTDMFLSFETWHEPQAIAAMASLVPFSREEGAAHELFAVQSERLREKMDAKIRPLPLETIHPISSSQVRRLLQTQEKQDSGGAMLWPSVYGYILREGLYGAKTSMHNLSPSRLRAVSYSMMHAKRLPHVKGTEETAVALALLWGENPDYARRAAILHDCTKYYTMEAQLDICKKYQVKLDALERKSEKMLHAKTGAALARHVFGEPEEICHAIERHTTGAADMTIFDQILYLADYVEPTRDFDGVDTLRQLAFSDINKAMLMGLELTMQELAQKNAVVHPNTLETFQKLQRILSI